MAQHPFKPGFRLKIAQHIGDTSHTHHKRNARSAQCQSQIFNALAQKFELPPRDIRLGPKTGLKHIKRQTLVITPADREDLILAALSWNLSETSTVNQIAGMVITGKDKPGKFVNRVMKNSHIPVIYTNNDSFMTASMVHDLKVKIKVTDSEKIRLSQELVDKHIDFDYIMENC